MERKAKKTAPQPLRSTLRRSEILRGEKIFSSIFREGKVVSHGAIRCHYTMLPRDPAALHERIKVGFTVPRKRVKRAVDRNKLKRFMRESYRLRKTELAGDIRKVPFNLECVFVYQGSFEKPNHQITFQEIETDVLRCLQKIRDRTEEKMTT